MAALFAWFCPSTAVYGRLPVGSSGHARNRFLANPSAFADVVARAHRRRQSRTEAPSPPTRKHGRTSSNRCSSVPPQKDEGGVQLLEQLLGPLCRLNQAPKSQVQRVIARCWH
ncbi:hypothetical protein BKA81DRAFT_381881 [Phyllosticta paracitricarpa]|uniref:Secreted protein n=1 Tax=Phyllosticta citricarpa TaxID=55181 RepID=A0ABR1M2Y0_9PEZI